MPPTKRRKLALARKIKFIRGTKATIAFRSLKGGPMADRRTRRNRTRADQRRRAIAEAS